MPTAKVNNTGIVYDSGGERDSVDKQFIVISFNPECPFYTDYNSIMYYYNIISDLVYEICFELTQLVNTAEIDDRTKLILDYKRDCPNEYTAFETYLNTLFVASLNNDNIPSDVIIKLPDHYLNWLGYHSNEVFTEIGKKLAVLGSKITINLYDVFADYLLPGIKTIIENECKNHPLIKCFTIVDFNDPSIEFIKTIEDNNKSNKSLEYLPYESDILKIQMRYIAELYSHKQEDEVLLIENPASEETNIITEKGIVISSLGERDPQDKRALFISFNKEHLFPSDEAYILIYIDIKEYIINVIADLLCEKGNYSRLRDKQDLIYGYEDYEAFIVPIYSRVLKCFLSYYNSCNDFPLYFPKDYINWLVNHTNTTYARIGRILETERKYERFPLSLIISHIESDIKFIIKENTQITLCSIVEHTHSELECCGLPRKIWNDIPSLTFKNYYWLVTYLQRKFKNRLQTII